MKKSLAACIAGLLSITLSSPAAAYLDPGTGSIILQGALAAIAGAIVVLKLYWMRLKSFISSLFTGSKGTRANLDSENETNADSKD